MIRYKEATPDFSAKSAESSRLIAVFYTSTTYNPKSNYSSSSLPYIQSHMLDTELGYWDTRDWNCAKSFWDTHPVFNDRLIIVITIAFLFLPILSSFNPILTKTLSYSCLSTIPLASCHRFAPRSWPHCCLCRDRLVPRLTNDRTLPAWPQPQTIAHLQFDGLLFAPVVFTIIRFDFIAFWASSVPCLNPRVQIPRSPAVASSWYFLEKRLLERYCVAPPLFFRVVHA